MVVEDIMVDAAQDDTGLLDGGAALMWEVAERVSDAFDDIDVEIDVRYFLGDLQVDPGKDAVSIRLSTARGHIYLVEDRFGACWVVYHREGFAGTARRCLALDAGDLAAECCSFLEFTENAFGEPKARAA